MFNYMVQDQNFTSMHNRRQFIRKSVVAGIGMSAVIPTSIARSASPVSQDLKLGIIGLDTSHSPAFTKYINDPEKTSMQGITVTAAYPFGSTMIESSASRIPEYTEQMKGMGVTIIDDIDSLIDQVDGILLETNDGTLHLEQALQVIQARKPMFIDKPVAADLEDVLRIYRAAKENQVPVFSSSSLRYIKKAQEIRYEKVIGEVTGASTFSPEHWEPSHTDLFWYGIHGVELLFTLMNTGCQHAKRILTDNTDLVIGKWSGGRLGTFRGDLEGRQRYGGTAFGTEGVMELGSYDGYDPLLEKIIEFFRTGISPVDDAETLELYTFMEAADVSKNRNGDWVELKEVYDSAMEKSKQY
jgi:predicted dehydrogenase